MTFFIAIGIFAIAYAIIISEKIHRTVIALIGASLMIILGVISQEQAIEGVDFNTLGLLIGMMVIVDIAKHSGVFQYVAIWAAKAGKGSPMPIFILLGIITAVFSALLDNVTTVLLMTPVAFVIANNLKLNPKPYLFGPILLSNIGGAATLIGDPPNILIGSAAGLSFNDFIFNMAPASVLIAVATLLILFFWYRKEFVATDESKKAIMRFEPSEAITDKKLLIKSLIVIGLVLFGFFTHGFTHLEAATIALAGAALLLLLTFNEPDHHLQNAEWTTIFFFIGLFVLVVGLEQVGAIYFLAQKLFMITEGNLTMTTIFILWGSAFFSSVVDNIPFVATMIPLVKDIGTISGLALAPLWWALTLGADIGGNATIVGASANLVVSGMAEKEGHKIGFVEYMKVALPLTVVAMVISTIYIYWRYLM